MEKEFIPQAYCGLYCAACPQYRAAQMAGEGESSDNFCYGCKSSGVGPGWCSTCSLKACAREKGIEFCFQCASYPCDNLDRFKNDAHYPYHGEIYDYMRSIKDKGEAVWLKEMNSRWSCHTCGNSYGWWDQACSHCGSKTLGYKKPDAI